MAKLISGVSVVVGLLLSAGCTTTVSSGPRRAPAPKAQPVPPAHAKAWGRPNPRLVVIAGTKIKYVEDADEDIFVLGGVWYRFSGGVWFRCVKYGGDWVRIDSAPDEFQKIPPGHAKHRVVGKPVAGPKKAGPSPRKKPKGGAPAKGIR